MKKINQYDKIEKNTSLSLLKSQNFLNNLNIKKQDNKKKKKKETINNNINNILI